MSDIQTGITFVDGQTVDAATLNNAINNATILPGFYSGKSVGSPTTTDKIVFFQNSSGQLRAAPMSTAVPIKTVGLTMPAEFAVGNSPLTSSGTIGVTKNVQGPHLFYAGPASGASAAPTFRAILPSDLNVLGTVDLGTASTVTVDWLAALAFFKNLTANTTFNFINGVNGTTITIVTQQTGTFTATFATAKWQGGTAPVATPTSGRFDFYTFTFIAGLGVLGRYWLNFV